MIVVDKGPATTGKLNIVPVIVGIVETMTASTNIGPHAPGLASAVVALVVVTASPEQIVVAWLSPDFINWL